MKILPRWYQTQKGHKYPGWQYGCYGPQLCHWLMWLMALAGDLTGWCECQEYPPPSPLSSTPPAIQSFQCFTGFIECEMSKYYSLELLSWNKITDWFFILQVSLWIKILFLIWKILGIYDDSEAWSEYKSL